jgi:hypothetical protein
MSLSCLRSIWSLWKGASSERAKDLAEEMSFMVSDRALYVHNLSGWK